MGKFFKENGYNMVKLFVNQIGLTVFGTMLTLATTGNDPLLLGASIFSILFFLVINYTTVWEIGAKDKIRVDAGRLQSMPHKGFLLALGSNIPNYLITLLIALGILLDTEFGQSMSVICNVIARLLNGMYLGVLDAVEAAVYPATAYPSGATLADMWWWFAAITLPSLFVGWLAYFLGARNFRISALFGIKPKPQTAKKKN